ncbi:Splicing factor 3B subunit 10 (SF3b10) family protein [Leishmania donovani]|uniref:Splicing factor 3B subunit 10 (SF3b10) family protein n=1 Tax=Leishmania donovani TaxID=5661 RepID=A0A504XBX4_LEIDO|nr:Splicing factor 3B subunit 10 (SF3b10) family protein [Leishmania donovani]
MSLFTQRGRVEVSSGDSEPDSIASTVVDSADELIEGLARMALAGHYSGGPRAYETNQLLQGSGDRTQHGFIETGDAHALRDHYSSSLSSMRAKMYRHLAREYLRGNSSVYHAPRRKPDEQAQSRLLKPNQAQLARQVEKYERCKRRDEEARRYPKPVRVPAEAVKRGTRLFLEAQARADNVKLAQEAQARQKAAQETKECTFHPSVSAYAARFAAGGAYYPLESRLEDQAAHDEKRLRMRLERMVEREKECTFKPTLSPGTEELMSNRSRRASPPRHEPFEPGERLYRDGGERLLRQQVRLQRAAAEEQRHVVGGGLTLSHADAQQLADRFTAWAAARAANREELRIALEQQERETPRAAAKREATAGRGGGALRSRSSSNSKGPTTAPRFAQLARSGSGSAYPAATDASAPLPLKINNDFASPAGSMRAYVENDNLAASRVPSDRACSPWLPSDAVCPATATSSPRSLAAPAACPAANVSVHKELLRIRLGALFYKYAVSPTANAVCLAQVKQQVRCYYPEDSGIAAALASSFADRQQPITKTEFMAALARYVAQYGIQPWCLPHRSDPNAIVAVPYSPSDSSAADSAGAVTSNGLVSSGDSLGAMDGDAPVSTPPWGRGTGAVSSAPGRRSEIGCSVVAPATAHASEGASDEKPARTHIYTVPVQADCSPPTSAPATVTPSCAAKASVANTAATLRREASAGKSREPRCGSSQSRVASKDTPPTKIPTAAADFVRGYEDHVQRRRRAVDRARAASEAGQKKASEECTFRPTLTPRSVVLSEMNMEKRMAYARELQLRRPDLYSLSSSVLGARSDDDGLPRAAPSQRDARACDALASTQTPPPTPSTKHPSVSLSSTSPQLDFSPSFELSSPSCSTPRHDSGNVSSKPAATPSPSHEEQFPGEAGTRRAVAKLEQLLSDVAGKERSTQPAQEGARAPPPYPPVHAGVSSVAHDGATTATDGTDVTQTLSTAPVERSSSDHVAMGDPFVRPGLEYAPHVEQVLLKHEGTMTLETTKDDWMRYQHRDTLATIIEHRDQLEYLCVAENLPPAKMERVLLERMVDPIAKR